MQPHYDAAQIVSFPPVIPQNPYQRLLYDALGDHGFSVHPSGELKVLWLVGARKRVCALHFHWPGNYYRHLGRGWRVLSLAKLALFAVRLAVARALGMCIVWTMHELYPLNALDRRIDLAGSWVLASFSQVIMTNDEQTAAQARAKLGRVARHITIVRHSSYEGAYPPGRSRDEVRDDLGIARDAFVFLIFGHVTPYKRVSWFVDVFREARLANAAIVVAGLVQDEPSASEIRMSAHADDRVKPLLEFISEDRVAELYGASDAAVCPRQDGGTSGALLLSLSMGVPVLVADVGTYTEVTHADEGAFLFEAYDAASLAAAYERAAADPAAARAKGEAGRALAGATNWDDMAAVAAGLLRTAMRPRRRAMKRAVRDGQTS